MNAQRSGAVLSPIDPARAYDGARDDAVCPECNHERTAPGIRLSVVVRRLLRMGPPKPRCEYEEDSVESELGLPGTCGCQHTFHWS